jgi:hypothetical protein
LRYIPHTCLLQRPELTGEMQLASPSQSPYAFACAFYGISPISSWNVRHGSFEVPFASVFQEMVTFNVRCANHLLSASGSRPFLKDLFSQSLLLLHKLVSRLGSPLSISWDPSEWLEVVLMCMGHEVSAFYKLKLALILHRHPILSWWIV